jgi:hypothetical protein
MIARFNSPCAKNVYNCTIFMHIHVGNFLLFLCIGIFLIKGQVVNGSFDILLFDEMKVREFNLIFVQYLTLKSIITTGSILKAT